jgi:hypothetical protein
MASHEKASQKAERLVNDYDLALRQWYREYRAQETGIPGTEVSFPSTEKMERALEDWLDHARDQLYQIICVKWNYPQKRKQAEFQEAASLAVALADFLIAQYTKVPSPLALACILVMKGLDAFCSGELNRPEEKLASP